MMKQKWIENALKYDGTQLRSLYAYMTYEIPGDSIVSWRGACDISFDHMVDGEDVLQKSQICGSDMVHFIIEMFDRNLREGVFAQRMLAAIINDFIYEKTQKKLRRDGDDLFLQDKKLSISIATKSPVSTLVHFAVNISNKGTPVPTCALEDLNINSELFAKEVMARFSTEYDSIVFATQKVRPVQ
jgi:hypothetical protein